MGFLHSMSVFENIDFKYLREDYFFENSFFESYNIQMQRWRGTDQNNLC